MINYYQICSKTDCPLSNCKHFFFHMSASTIFENFGFSLYYEIKIKRKISSNIFYKTKLNLKKNVFLINYNSRNLRLRPPPLSSPLLPSIFRKSATVVFSTFIRHNTYIERTMELKC